jgi:hypothetical protein
MISPPHDEGRLPRRLRGIGGLQILIKETTRTDCAPVHGGRRGEGGVTSGTIDDCEASMSEPPTRSEDEETALVQRIAEAGWTPMDETALPMTANVKVRFQPGTATYYTGATLRSSYGKTRIEALRQFAQALSEEREAKRRK